MKQSIYIRTVYSVYKERLIREPTFYCDKLSYLIIYQILCHLLQKIIWRPSSLSELSPYKIKTGVNSLKLGDLHMINS